MRLYKGSRRESTVEYREETTMRKLVDVALFGAFISVAMSAPDDKMYTTKYDNIDVDSVIKSERLLKSYVGCLLDEKPCTPDGSELKKNLPEALTNNCASCSEAQKNIADKIAHHLIDHEPEDWSRLETKYDPTGGYKKMYLGDDNDEA